MGRWSEMAQAEPPKAARCREREARATKNFFEGAGPKKVYFRLT